MATMTPGAKPNMTGTGKKSGAKGPRHKSGSLLDGAKPKPPVAKKPAAPTAPKPSMPFTPPPAPRGATTVAAPPATPQVAPRPSPYGYLPWNR